MVVTLLLNVLVIALGIIWSIFPIVTLNDIPVVGSLLRDALVSVMGVWGSAMETLPYLRIVWNLFIYVVIPFEFSLMLLKFFLGSRTPVANVNDD